MELLIFSATPLGEKPYIWPKNLSCDQKFPKFLEIWARGSLWGAMMFQGSLSQDSKPIFLFHLFFLSCCFLQFFLQTLYSGLCTHFSCPVMEAMCLSRARSLLALSSSLSKCMLTLSRLASRSSLISCSNDVSSTLLL